MYECYSNSTWHGRSMAWSCCHAPAPRNARCPRMSLPPRPTRLERGARRAAVHTADSSRKPRRR
eukprot:scaffold2601_cov117-Isochrysis_galbana.AAC.14